MCWEKKVDSLLQQNYELCALQVKKIGGLLVGDPCSGGIRRMDMGIHMAVRPSAGLPWGPGQTAGEPAVRLAERDFDYSGEASSGTVRDFGSVLGREACLGRRVADLEVV